MTGAAEETDPHDDRLRLWGRLASALLAFLGLLSLLRVGVSGPAETVTILVVHPVTAMIYLLVGLVGIALVTTPGGRRAFARGAGAGLVLWGALGLILQGSPTEIFSGDRETIAFHLILGAAGLILGFTGPRAVAAEESA